MSGQPVWILGTAMTAFGRFPQQDIVDLGSAAAAAALADADVTMADMQVMAAGCLFEAAAAPGQRIQKQLGQTGIPVFNVANACATGATAIRAVHLSIAAGETDIGLAVGVEKMGKQGLIGAAARAEEQGARFEARGRDGAIRKTEGILGTTLNPGIFAHAGMEYVRDHPGVGLAQFAKVAEKNHAHSTLNPLSQYQKRYSLDEIMNAEMIAYPNTLLMCCPTADGAAAIVLVGEERLRRMSAQQQARAVKISAAVMQSDPWTEHGHLVPDFNVVTQIAAKKAYASAGVGPEDLDLVELHDCFATAELLHYENLGLCEPGGAGDFIDSGAPWRDGKLPVNVSGGLLSKGHPLGATGIANLYEVATHLRGEAGARQVEGARVGLTHVLGVGSACVVHILEKERSVVRYRIQAKNTSKHSDNKIHDDAVARQLGYAGGLVPGVDVYAYQTRPFVERWHRRWLERGGCELQLISPVYDGDELLVTSSDHGAATDVYVVNTAGLACAWTHGWLDETSLPPDVADYPPALVPPRRRAVDLDELPGGTVLGEIGDTFDGGLGRGYLGDVRETLDIYPSESLAHPGWLLRWSNWILKANVELGPWIHTASVIRNFGLVHDGQRVDVRGRIRQSYERKGQLYVVLDLVLVADGERVVQQVVHTAIVSPVARN